MDDLWFKNAVFYEVYVRAFRDSNGDGHGDLRGLTSRLDYLCDLGVDCIWLLPINDSPLVDDGYDVADYYRILPQYGTMDDFRDLVAQAHARGMRIITDLVMNHTSDQHPWFVESRSAKTSPKRDYYLWSRTGTEYGQARIIFLDSQQSNWQLDPHTGEYYFHRFYAEQPDLNYDNPAVQQEMLNVIKFWLDLGIDGFRCDAVPYLFKREGTVSENLPETHAFLKRVRGFVSANYAGKVLLAEANQWPRDVRPYFGDGDEFQMAFHFPLMPRIFMSLATGDRNAIVSALENTPSIPESCQWCIFLRNHDELTLEMVTPIEREWMWQTYAPTSRMRLNLGIRRRLAPLLNNDRHRIELANSLLFTLPGSPILYYGDEIGMGDNIWLKDRDGVRTPMQWNAGRNAGFSEADEKLLYSPVIQSGIFGYTEVNVEAQRADPESLWNTIRHMISVRKQYRVFGWGDFSLVLPENAAVLSYLRQYQGQAALIIHNLSADEQEASLNLRGFKGSAPLDLINGQFLPVLEEDSYCFRLGPFQYLWLLLTRDET